MHGNDMRAVHRHSDGAEKDYRLILVRICASDLLQRGVAACLRRLTSLARSWAACCSQFWCVITVGVPESASASWPSVKSSPESHVILLLSKRHAVHARLLRNCLLAAAACGMEVEVWLLHHLHCSARVKYQRSVHCARALLGQYSMLTFIAAGKMGCDHATQQSAVGSLIASAGVHPAHLRVSPEPLPSPAARGC